MNYTTTQVPIDEAARRLNCRTDEVRWWSWPETFGSTAGPTGGIGGQMLSSFQVFGFEGPDGERIMSCATKWRTWSTYPHFAWGRK